MKNNKFKRSIKKGFTLVELVVVIAVIAILAGVSIGAYFGITNSARDSKLLQEAKTVSTTLKLANGHGAELSSKGLTIEELDTLSTEVNRISGSISYYLTLDINDYAVEGFTIQFVKVDTSLDLNTYDYFRYYTEGDTSRYCLFSLINESSSLHDNVPIVPTTVSESNTIAGTADVVFEFTNDTRPGYVGPLLDPSIPYEENGNSLKVIDCSNAYLSKFGTKYNVLNLAYLDVTEYDYAFVSFEVPSDVKTVVIRYAAYRAVSSAKIKVNDIELREIIATIDNGNEANIGYATITMGSNKIVTIKTTAAKRHASIDYIAFYK